MPSSIRCSDGRPVIGLDVGRFDKWPDSLRAEIEAVDVTPFDAYLKANPTSSWHEEDLSELAAERALFQALSWLSGVIGGPVSYWHHEGDHGLLADVFVGVAPLVMWENDAEFQDENWDESKPRSAFTAALWHIGASAPNVDECSSMSMAFSQPRIPLAYLHGRRYSPTEPRQFDRNVSALTTRLNQLFSSTPPGDTAGADTMSEKLLARLRKFFSRR